MNCEKFCGFALNGSALQRIGLILNVLGVKAALDACPAVLSWCLCAC